MYFDNSSLFTSIVVVVVDLHLSNSIVVVVLVFVIKVGSRCDLSRWILLVIVDWLFSAV